LFVSRSSNEPELAAKSDVAQTNIIKKLGGGIRLDLAQYRELAAFAQFASDLDAETKAQIDRGQRVTELMKQNQYSPLSVAPPPNFLMMLVCAAPPTRDTDSPALIAGRIPELNKSVSKKI
jgi:hypothetical protein